MDELVSAEDVRMAVDAIFDGGRESDPHRVPLELRVACAIAAARFGATRPVVVLQKKERNHG